MSGSGSSAQFAQLPMFMTAKELKNKVVPGDWRPGQSEKTLWGRKLREANHQLEGDGQTLADSIRDHGIRTPVELYQRAGVAVPTLVNGHHRVAVAHSLTPNYLVPVVHS